jgi:hypothetical protein
MAEFLATDGPVVFAFKGKTYNVPQAVMGDYGGWLAQLHEKRKAAMVKLVPLGLSPTERFKLLKQIELDQPSHWDLVAEIGKPEGTTNVLKIVLPKAQMTPEEVSAVLAELPANEQYKLACYTSGLIPPGQLVRMFGLSQEDIERNNLQMWSIFAEALKAAGVSEAMSESVLLRLPGVTPEVLRGEPPASETADKAGLAVGNA